MAEIKEEFFQAFGIEQRKSQQIIGDGLFCSFVEEEYYPEITSAILLQLICILVQWDEDYGYLIKSKYIGDLTQEILSDCIQKAKQSNEYFIEQVQSLF